MKKILSYLLFAGASYMGYSQCTPIVAPWIDGFETITTTNIGTNNNCWSANGSGPFWGSFTGGGGSFNTGPSGAYAGSRYAMLECSTADGVDSLKTPQIDISGLTYPALKFYYHMFGDQMGDLRIDVWDGTSWSPVIFEISGQQHAAANSPWTEQIVSLSAFAGSTIIIRFEGERGTGFRSDMCLDDVEVFECTPSFNTINGQSCGYYTAPSGKQLHDAGTYLDTIPNAIGCDSIITINLSTTNTFATQTITNICGTYTLPFSGIVVGDDGIYTDTTTNAANCDSVITFDLDFDNTYSSFATTACDVYTAPSGAQYTISGVYMDTIPNAANCDSIMTINLDMFYANSITIIATACNPPYISPNGNSYSTSGTYVDASLTSANGCDSTVFVNLTVTQGNTQTINISACDEWTSPSGMNTTTTSGTFTETFNGSTGCDSIIDYVVAINTVNTIATFVSALTVEAAETGATYQWVDCNNGFMPIPNATNKTFQATVNGDYACIITKNGCTEMTNCVRLGSLGIDDDNSNTFSIYPNPSNGFFSIELAELSSATTVRITNAAGQLVYMSALNDTKTDISLEDIEAGVYFVSIENATSTVRKSMVIE